MSELEKSFYLEAFRTIGYPVLVSAALAFVVWHVVDEWIKVTRDNDTRRTEAIIKSINNREQTDREILSLLQKELEQNGEFLDKIDKTLEAIANSEP